MSSIPLAARLLIAGTRSLDYTDFSHSQENGISAGRLDKTVAGTCHISNGDSNPGGDAGDDELDGLLTGDADLGNHQTATGDAGGDQLQTQASDPGGERQPE